VARRSCAKMSHIRGVKLESRIIVPMSPPKCGRRHQYRPLLARATTLRPAAGAANLKLCSRAASSFAPQIQNRPVFMSLPASL
jgi:hypothetical protein